MRDAYGRGDRSSAETILKAEQQLSAAADALITLRNDVITLER